MTEGPKTVVVDLTAWREQREEAGALDINLGDGSKPVRLLPPELWPDAVHQQLRENPGDLDGQARAVLGDDYDRFIAGGGTARILNQLIIDRHELTAPE